MSASQHAEDLHSLPDSAKKPILRNMKSSDSGIMEFGDDSKTEEKLRQMQDEYFVPTHEVRAAQQANYSLLQFLEFFLYHLLYYILVGYLLVLLTLPIRKMRVLFINLQFTRLNSYIVSQMIFWVNSLMVVVAVFFVPNSLTSEISLLINGVSIITRASNIAAKYATLPAKQIAKYRSKVLSYTEFTDDFLLGKWADQPTHIIESEAISALQRNGFDNSIFHLSFLDKLNPDLAQKLSKIKLELVEFDQDETVLKLGEGKERIYYSGLLIFYVIVQKYNEEQKVGQFFMIIMLFVSVLWGFLPTFVKLYLGESLVNRQSVFDSITFFTNQAVCFLLFFLTNMFFKQAKVDLERTIYVMRQLSHLISTQKKTNEIKKILPTMNFLEEFSLNSWKILRRVAIDYGKKYFYRHEIYLPVVFLLGSLAFFAIFGLETIAKKFPTWLGPDFHLRRCQIALGIICLAFLSMTFTLLWSFAEVNEFFEFHTLKLYTVRQTLSDIHKYSDFYFRDHLSATHRQGYSLDINAIFNNMSGSHVHKRLAREIRLTLGDHLDAELKPFIQQTIQSIDNIIDEISVDQKYQSIEILGFIISKQFTVNLIVVIASVCITFYEIFLAG